MHGWVLDPNPPKRLFRRPVIGRLDQPPIIAVAMACRRQFDQAGAV
jgi:hypothetical protein